MRKLKLQMQLSVDGYVAGPNGEMDWMRWDWGDDIKNYVKEFTAPVDTLLLGRKLAEGFIPHWAGLMQDPATADHFTKKMVDTHKVVFSKTLKESAWENTVLATGDLVEEVNKLKAMDGGDLVTYGGASFTSALIKAGLIDEYHLFINPAAIGDGMPIFKQLEGKLSLKLIKSQAFEIGIVVLFYVPAS
jgi:dihydrofolate reductase